MIRLQSLMVTLVLLGSIGGRANAEVPKIIFDTDITGDVDDVKRAGMLTGDIGRTALLARDDALATAEARGTLDVLAGGVGIKLNPVGRPCCISDPTVLHEIVDGLRAGACGYLLKRSSPERVIAAIQEVQDGGVPMTPEIVIAIGASAKSPEGV